MNIFESKGVDFLAKINSFVEKEDLKLNDSLFKVLDQLHLKEGYHLGLKLASENGLGDESWFYTYPIKNDDNIEFNTFEKDLNIFKNVMVEKTEMGAWQAYLLSASPSLLPLWWHSNYMRRTYFFDRDHFRGIILSFGDSIPINIDDIPQPSVNMCNNEAIVTCPYWNDWKGLVLESVRVAFKDDGKIKFDIVNSRALYKYDCGICF